MGVSRAFSRADPQENQKGVPYAFGKTKQTNVATAKATAPTTLWDFMRVSGASKVARHQNVGTKSPPESVKPLTDLQFVAKSDDFGGFLEALRALTEIGVCFKVSAKNNEVNPTGVALYIKRQCIVPAAGRYEFK